MSMIAGLHNSKDNNELKMIIACNVAAVLLLLSLSLFMRS